MEKIGEALYQSSIAVQKLLSGAKEYSINILGIKTRYLYRKGKGNEAIIMLHGVGDSKETFTLIQKYIKKDYHIFVPDLPGHGQAEKNPLWGYQLSRFVEWTNQFIEKLFLEKTHLMGSSMGGTIACLMAIQKPSQIESLTLLNPGGVRLKEFDSFYQLYEQGHNIFDIRNYQDWEFLMNRLVAPGFKLPGLLKNYLSKKAIKQNDWNHVMFKDLQNGIKSFDHPRADEILLNNHLHKIVQPTCILWGKEDGVFPYQTAYYFQERIPNCQVRVLNDIGHGPHIEAPLQTAQIFNQFVTSLRSH